MEVEKKMLIAKNTKTNKIITENLLLEVLNELLILSG